MYPLKFGNIYFEKVWGGRDFQDFRDNLIEGSIGESWDVACHSNGNSVIVNGEYNGVTLSDLIENQPRDLLGTAIEKNWFPLLVKLINAKEDLSIQVHPNDEYAKANEGEMGKTEVWYILNADDDAELVVGTKGCSFDTFKSALECGEITECVNRFPIQKGDVYFVKSGLVHAIGGGIVVAEIQQNSDTTYRLHDYGRGRDIHVDKALDVVDLSLSGDRSLGLSVNMERYKKTYYCLCKEFSLEEYEIYEELIERSDSERFYIFTCVEGKGMILADNYCEDIVKGDSIMIPATLGEYRIRGEGLKLLKSYVPDVESVKNEILDVILK